MTTNDTPPTSGSSDAAGTDSLVQRVNEVLALIRPMIQADGGDIELVRIEADGVVVVRLLGACIGCPSSAITLKHGIERQLLERVPEVTGVRADDNSD